MAVYLGTATPSAYYLGSSAVSKIYLGSAQVWPVVSAATLTIARNNGTSTFTGSGTSASPFTRAAGSNFDDADGLSHYSWTVNATATVTITLSFSDDDGGGYTARVYKNGTQVGANIASGTVTRSFSAVSGDVITVGVPGSWPDATQYFYSVSVYAA
jgi:hypothetical protein